LISTEYIPFYWDSHYPLMLDVLLLPGQDLNFRLYDAERNLIAEAEPLTAILGASEAEANGKRLYAPEMSPGWYALAVNGGEEVTEYLLQFHLWRVYLPIILRGESAPLSGH